MQRHGESGTHPLQGEALVDPAGGVWLPYDVPHVAPDTSSDWMGLSASRTLPHAGRQAFTWQAPETDELHVINGMGVALGDSVIGLSVLAWIKNLYPSLRIHVYRSRHTPASVERLYQLAGDIVDHVRYLPYPLADIPKDAVDLSDFLHWPQFHSEPMIDFFLRSLGWAVDSMPAYAKANRWLAHVDVPTLPSPWHGRPYVLFCDRAGTPLRSIPSRQAWLLVDRIWQRYRLPVVGFNAIDHPNFHDVSSLSPATEHFLAWVQQAQAVIATDSAAVHIAAGMDVPTLAGFVSIDPLLRARDYPLCRAMDLRTPLTDGLHHSDDAYLLHEVERIWQAVAESPALPWPRPRGGC